MKIYVLVARLALLAIPLASGAGEFQSGDFVCRTLGTPVVAVEIAGYTGPGGAVTIPSVVEGLPVTGIGEAAFSGHQRISSVIIPDGARTIGDRAFSWCTDLAFVSLPETLTSIGNQAFQVTSLLSVTLPNSLTNIGEEAFYGCDLNTLSLPVNVQRIGDRAFAHCTALSSLTVAAENSAFKSEDGVLFDKSGRTLVVFPHKRLGECGRGAYEIPAGTTHIAPSAFEGCRGLTNVLVPGTVTHIQSRSTPTTPAGSIARGPCERAAAGGLISTFPGGSRSRGRLASPQSEEGFAKREHLRALAWMTAFRIPHCLPPRALRSSVRETD